MRLSRETLSSIRQSGIPAPSEEIFSLPERVLQFGTGVLLRGLCDYFIDTANSKGIYNGRVIVVKSTDSDTGAFERQDNLYTLCVKGIENNLEIDEFVINSAISRVISASTNWNEILACASIPSLKVIISNTTEVGIVLAPDNIEHSPPKSFPGKLLAFLYERYKAFGGSEESGMIIIPTELLVDNAKKLLSILLELAALNKLPPEFIKWLEERNYFCSSLVDRIVPGKLNAREQMESEEKIRYTDELMIMAEPYRLWAIETDNHEVAKHLSFAQADKGVILTPSIGKFRELKLRLLNGPHSFSCGLAFLAGFKTVREAMTNNVFSAFIRELCMHEMALAISGDQISYAEACDFGEKVISRFRNPFLDHAWLNITLQYSEKMKMRNVPMIKAHYSKFREVPVSMAMGFAGYLWFMKCHPTNNDEFVGRIGETEYLIRDEKVGYFAKVWANGDANQVVDTVLQDKQMWGEDLSVFPGFVQTVKANLNKLMITGVLDSLQELYLKQ